MVTYVLKCTLEFHCVAMCPLIPYVHVSRLSDVLESDPENGNATFCRGLVQYDLQNYATTEQLFLMTLNITANHSGALYNLGILYTGNS